MTCQHTLEVRHDKRGCPSTNKPHVGKPSKVCIMCNYILKSNLLILMCICISQKRKRKT